MLGCHPASDIYWKVIPVNRDDGFTHKYICRQAVAILDSGTDGNPFDENYRDNYVEGKGYTREVALRDMEANFRSIGDSLWSE